MASQPNRRTPVTNPTTRAAHVIGFDDEGQHIGAFTMRDRADWSRGYRETRERAGEFGTILLYAATVDALTGKLLSVAAMPSIIR
jgi:hypothetical protein